MYSVGEPLNAEIIHWVRRTLDKEIYDTWFQTETGGHMIVNHPGMKIKPGSMGKPIDGMEAVVAVDGEPCDTPDTVGSLWVKKGWPSMFVEYLNMPDTYAGISSRAIITKPVTLQRSMPTATSGLSAAGMMS
jgi:acetyl-CoA synthetase